MSDNTLRLEVRAGLDRIKRLEAELAEARAATDAAERERDEEKKWRLAVQHSADTFREQVGKLQADLAATRTALAQEQELRIMQLAAISTAALSNTPESAEAQRLPEDSPYRTAAYGDTVRAVEREMGERAAHARTREALTQLREHAEVLREARDAIDLNENDVPHQQCIMRLSLKQLEHLNALLTLVALPAQTGALQP